MITWHTHSFTLKLSVLGSEFDINGPPEKNRFRFRPERDEENEEIYLYKLEPLPETDMKPAWRRCSNLLPQPGVPLRWDLADADKLDVTATPAQVRALVKQIKEQKIDDPSLSFERLVGTLRFNHKDQPVSFYRVANCYKDDTKLLLIALVQIVDGTSPTGTVAAEN